MMTKALPTVCVTVDGAGVDNVREQKQLVARKILENGDETHLSDARFVRCLVTN
jgi:hypothetical protein